MQIYGPYRVSTANPASQAGPTRQASGAGEGKPTAQPRPSAAPVDQLDLSSSATPVNRVAETASPSVEGIRVDRVAELRRQIASGTYETPEKLDAALEKMFDGWA